MRTLVLLVSITTTALTCWGQDTKQVKKEKEGYLEVFHVLKSDKNIKHGMYEKYLKYSNPMARGQLLTERGQYENNRKTGPWTFYWGEDNVISKGSYSDDLETGKWEYFKDGVVVEKGDYNNGKRDGLWTYFMKEKGIVERGFYKEGDKVGKWTYMYHNIPVQTYDHTLDSVLQYFDDKSQSEVFEGSSGEAVQVVLNRPPQYKGHKRHLQADMAPITEYPLEARRMALEGKVLVSFIVNEDGSTSDFKIIQDVGGNCGRAVISAFKSNASKWIPGIYNGAKVKVRYYQTVSFTLSFDPNTGLGATEIVYE